MNKLFILFFCLIIIYGLNVNAEIRIGTEQSEIFSTFGYPDSALYDGDYKETWIYDSVEYKDDVFNLSKNLTVVVKFDENKNVINFSYYK